MPNTESLRLEAAQSTARGALALGLETRHGLYIRVALTMLVTSQNEAPMERMRVASVFSSAFTTSAVASLSHFRFRCNSDYIAFPPLPVT